MFRPSFCMTEWSPTCFGHHFVWQDDLLHVSAIILYDIMTSYMFRPSFCMTEWSPTCFGHHFVRQNDLCVSVISFMYDRTTSYLFGPPFCMTEWPPSCSDHHFVRQIDLLYVSHHFLCVGCFCYFGNFTVYVFTLCVFSTLRMVTWLAETCTRPLCI